MELTQEETNLILERRRQQAAAHAYNSALADVYNILVTTFPASETRAEMIGRLQDLRKTVP